jgi:hypothetical protein
MRLIFALGIVLASSAYAGDEINREQDPPTLSTDTPYGVLDGAIVFPLDNMTPQCHPDAPPPAHDTPTS